MTEHHTPLGFEVDQASNLTDLMTQACAATPARPLYRRWDGARWEDVTGTQFLAQVRALARGLVGAGVQVGDRVALMARTRYEWTLTDAAIWYAGAVTVPIYETSARDQTRWILADSGAVAVVVESARHAETVAAVRGEAPDLAHVWTMDAGDLDDLASPRGPGSAVSDEQLEAARSAATHADLATIIYTSGTTGRPKGCQLTHGNFVVLARSGVRHSSEVFAGEGASTLLFLPLAHVFARYMQVLCWVSPVTVGHAADVKNLTADLSSFSPTFILAVPRVFEKVYNSAEQKAAASGRGRIFAAAAATAIAWSQAKAGSGPGPLLRARHALFDRLVYTKLRAALGGRAAYAVSGGAPLGERLGHFFRGVGLTVLQGYGLTETTAPSTVATPRDVRMATVGTPLPGCSVRIEDDGEILLKGPNIFAGYWNNPAADAEAFTDGWFRTGDRGSLDADGFLTITGRKKEIIVTAAGKNVAPAALEDQLRAHALISQAVVVGDQKPYVAALLTLDPDMLPTWLTRHGKPVVSAAEAAQDPDVAAELQKAVDAANASVSKAESIRRYKVLAQDLTEESGHLTPSMKIKRSAVMADHAADVEALYAP